MKIIFVSLGHWRFQARMRNTEDRKEINKIDRYESKEDSLGTRGINFVEHESRDGVFHKLTVHRDDLDPLGDVERTITYEWED